jgi:hypothetical protein
MSVFISQVANIASNTLIVIILGEDDSDETDTSVVSDVFNLCRTLCFPRDDKDRTNANSFLRRWNRGSYAWRIRTRLKLAFGRLILW